MTLCNHIDCCSQKLEHANLIDRLTATEKECRSLRARLDMKAFFSYFFYQHLEILSIKWWQGPAKLHTKQYQKSSIYYQLSDITFELRYHKGQGPRAGKQRIWYNIEDMILKIDLLMLAFGEQSGPITKYSTIFTYLLATPKEIIPIDENFVPYPSTVRVNESYLLNICEIKY